MKINWVLLSVLATLLFSPGFSVAGLFEEKFEDSGFSNRGWYDNTNPVLSSSGAVSGSTRSAEFRFPVGATTPVNGKSMRKAFAETESVYVRYYVKYSDNWQGSNRNYHPHEFYILTNKDDAWTGPAYTYLTAYIEQNGLRPNLGIQDGRNIDLGNIEKNMVNVTENRSLAGCNGDSDGHGSGSCYAVGSSVYWNGKTWMAAGTPQIKTGTWHKVETYFRLNSISNGKGVADGILQYWLDGKLIINHSNIMFRTGQHPDMKFNQFMIGPWIGDGSPVDQTFWVDNLIVARENPDQSDEGLAPPTNLRVIPES